MSRIEVSGDVFYAMFRFYKRQYLIEGLAPDEATLRATSYVHSAFTCADDALDLEHQKDALDERNSDWTR